MSYNKIIVNGVTKFDCSGVTAVASDVASGKTFVDQNGDIVTGTSSGGGGTYYGWKSAAFVLVPNTYISSTDGTEIAYNNWSSSDYIDISAFDTIKMAGTLTYSNAGVYCAFYDTNKNFVAMTPTSQAIVKSVPSGAVYFRFSDTTAHMTTASLYGTDAAKRLSAFGFENLEYVNEYDWNVTFRDVGMNNFTPSTTNQTVQAGSVKFQIDNLDTQTYDFVIVSEVESVPVYTTEPTTIAFTYHQARSTFGVFRTKTKFTDTADCYTRVNTAIVPTYFGINYLNNAGVPTFQNSNAYGALENGSGTASLTKASGTALNGIKLSNSNIVLRASTSYCSVASLQALDHDASEIHHRWVLYRCPHGTTLPYKAFVENFENIRNKQRTFEI